VEEVVDWGKDMRVSKSPASPAAELDASWAMNWTQVTGLVTRASLTRDRVMLFDDVTVLSRLQEQPHRDAIYSTCNAPLRIM
jgi:hypothetical protein